MRRLSLPRSAPRRMPSRADAVNAGGAVAIPHSGAPRPLDAVAVGAPLRRRRRRADAKLAGWAVRRGEECFRLPHAWPAYSPCGSALILPASAPDKGLSARQPAHALARDEQLSHPLTRPRSHYLRPHAATAADVRNTQSRDGVIIAYPPTREGPLRSHCTPAFRLPHLEIMLERPRPSVTTTSAGLASFAAVILVAIDKPDRASPIVQRGRRPLRSRVGCACRSRLDRHRAARASSALSAGGPIDRAARRDPPGAGLGTRSLLRRHLGSALIRASDYPKVSRRGISQVRGSRAGQSGAVRCRLSLGRRACGRRGFRRWWDALLAAAQAPGRGIAAAPVQGNLTSRHALPTIRSADHSSSPARGPALAGPSAGRAIASGIPGARFVELTARTTYARRSTRSSTSRRVPYIQRAGPGARPHANPRSCSRNRRLDRNAARQARLAATGEIWWAPMNELCAARSRGTADVEVKHDGRRLPLKTFDGPAACDPRRDSARDVRGGGSISRSLPALASRRGRGDRR